MTASDPKLIAALVAARAALDSALLELTAEAPSASPSPASEEPQPAGPCKHENRTDQRTFGVTEAWKCDDCGYEYRR